MVGYRYIPARGDIVWLDFDPQKGKEITKRRPALVISSEEYNITSGLCLCMPITSKIKQYPFESKISVLKRDGAILCDQIRSFDWKARSIKFISKSSKVEFIDALGQFEALLLDDESEMINYQIYETT
jgi:mRNA interferase MazF